MNTRTTATTDTQADTLPELAQLWRYGDGVSGYLYGTEPQDGAGAHQVSCPDCGHWTSGATTARALAALARHRAGRECEAHTALRAALWAGLVPDNAVSGLYAGMPLLRLDDASRVALGVCQRPGTYYPGGRGRRARVSTRTWLSLRGALALWDLRETVGARRWSDVWQRVELWQDAERLARVDERLRRVELARGLSEPLTRSLARRPWYTAEAIALAVSKALHDAGCPACGPSAEVSP